MNKNKLFHLLVYIPILLIIINCASSDSLNKNAKNKNSKSDQIIESLNIKKGFHIADLGAGGGYYTYQFSKVVGNNGLVYAVDVADKHLNYIKNEIRLRNIQNVKIIKGRRHDPLLPLNKIDLIFLRNVYHHIDNRVKYFTNIKKTLKPNGRIAIIDYFKFDSTSYVTVFGHYTHKSTILKEMKQAGYVLIEDHKFLSKQTFTIYKVKKSTEDED